MKFMIGGLGNWYNDFKFVSKMVLKADELGFEGALMPDHYMWGTMGGRMTRPDRFVTVDTWIALTHLAAQTENIKLGTLVTPIPFRPPGIMAKMVSTLDVLSNGRVIFGVGAGWAQEEFDGYSEWNSPKVRVDKTEEGIELMTKLWTEDEVNFDGNYYKAINAVIEPKTVQKPYPPLLFGGSGNRMLSLAGKYGDIVFIPPWGGPEKIEEGRKRVMTSAKIMNREDEISFMSGTMMGPQVNEIDEYSKRVELAVKSGDRYFLPSFGNREDSLELMIKFAKEVIPSFK
ncbi:MAG: LLM class flavin-dependent oxidoreductase [Candidatus Heimdallarchaeota archaeon]|nr:LLM class flavin-dependent oxidoreductase [Candidatus Heimdallarchaeota archaeon]MCK4877434.1 LLM class flavin-dependent oxidoreductase [Candidatus Heimdallarchaeota archaeon]